MRLMTLALLVGATMLAAPSVHAQACNGNPSALVEECHSFGQVGGEMNTPDVQTSGCLIDLNGQCVPTSASVQDGTGIGQWRATTVYVGVDINSPPVCSAISFSCSYSADTSSLTYFVIELLV